MWEKRKFAPEKGKVLCKIADIPRQDVKEFVFGEGKQAFRMIVLHYKNKYLAYLNACPHFSLPLNPTPGQFFTSDRSQLKCSMHCALFDIESGYCTDGPCLGDKLETIPIEIEREHLVIS